MTDPLAILDFPRNAPATVARPGADHGGIGSMAPQGYKRCSRCGEIKPLDGFSPHSRTGDGRASHCKECRRKDEAEKRRKYPQRYAAAKKRWRMNNPDKVAEEAKRQRERHPEQVEVRRQRYEKRYPERLQANKAVLDAVYRGKLIKPGRCEDCGNEFQKREIHGHHDDYDKPLEVEWLCPQCHVDLHKGLK